MGQTTTPDAGASVAGGLIAGGMMLIVYAAIFVLMIISYWKMFQKAGFNGALSLLLLVPCVNIGVIVWFAFTDWPALKGGYGGGASGPTNYYRPPDQGAPPSAPTG